MHAFASVTELNNYTLNLLTTDENLSSLSVVGEIVGFKLAASGHAYFTLKDANTQIKCVMFANYYDRITFVPNDGMRVILTGSATLYYDSGTYQLKVTTMRQDGIGEEQERLRQLLVRLNAEGLFDHSHKLKLPLLPRRIGIITSPVGKAIRDFTNTLKENNPHFDVLLYPVLVQGRGSSDDIVEALRYFISAQNVDVIVISRGGGPNENLSSFNDERIARLIYASNIPVVTAIGHDGDISVADYVADVYAITPTRAADLVLTKYAEFVNTIENKRLRLSIAKDKYMENINKQLDSLKNHKALLTPAFHLKNQQIKLKGLTASLNVSGTKLIEEQHNKIDMLRMKMTDSESRRIENQSAKLMSLVDKLEVLGPTSVLKRGFAYVNDGTNPITSVNDIKKDDKINIVLSNGSIDATVTNINVEE